MSQVLFIFPHYLFYFIIKKTINISMGAWWPRIIITVIVMGIDFVQWEVSECTLWQLLRVFLKREILDTLCPFLMSLFPYFGPWGQTWNDVLERSWFLKIFMNKATLLTLESTLWTFMWNRDKILYLLSYYYLEFSCYCYLKLILPTKINKAKTWLS